MGHRRLGRLPKTAGWKKLIAALDSPDLDSPTVARLTAQETRDKLRELGEDLGINYVQWLLTRVVWSSRSDDFADQLRSIGVDVSRDASAVQFFSRLFEHVTQEVQARTSVSPFVSFVEQAFRQTLTETISAESRTLFGSSMDDVQAACKIFSTQKGFGILSHRFYANILNRFVNYFVQKELSNYVGAGRRLSSIAEVSAFAESIREYCLQSAKIVQDFAGGWYSKYTWLAKGRLEEKDVRSLTSYAFKKLQMEMAREDAMP